MTIILIIESDPMYRTKLSKLLKAQDHRVIVRRPDQASKFKPLFPDRLITNSIPAARAATYDGIPVLLVADKAMPPGIHGKTDLLGYLQAGDLDALTEGVSGKG